MTNIFTDAKMVEYNGKEVKSITNNNGGVIWEKEEPTTNLTLTALGEGFAFGRSPIFSEDTITVDWGDGTTETLTTLEGKIHTYSDGLTEHTITLIGEVTELLNDSFYRSRIGEIYIPSTIMNFGDGLFSGTSLQSIIFSENCQLTELSNGCFDGCLITSISIPNTITSLGYSCFSGCTALNSINIPNGVINIGDSCFSGCTALNSINIPNGVINIGDACFRGCTALTSVSIPSSVTNIGKSSFFRCNVEDYQLYWEDSDIPIYYSSILVTGTNTVFTIPTGQTANYVAKGYPPNKLVERS